MFTRRRRANVQLASSANEIADNATKHSNGNGAPEDLLAKYRLQAITGASTSAAARPVCKHRVTLVTLPGGQSGRGVTHRDAVNQGFPNSSSSYLSLRSFGLFAHIQVYGFSGWLFNDAINIQTTYRRR
jgi:hypothetical protein